MNIRQFCQLCFVSTIIYSKFTDTFQITDLFGNYPTPLTKLGVDMVNGITNSVSSNDDLEPYIEIQLLFALKKNLITQPMADRINDISTHIFNSVDNTNETMFSKLEDAPFMPLYGPFIVVGLKLGLVACLILDAIHTGADQSVSLNQYKLFDPLVKTEHGEIFIERVYNIIKSNTQRIAETVDRFKQNIYSPLSMGCAINCTSSLRYILITLKSIYGGLYEV